MSVEQILMIAVPVAIFVAAIIAGFIGRQILFNRLRVWSRHTKTELDDIVIDAIRGPFIIWAAMLGLYLALELSTVPENIVAVSGKVILALGVLSIAAVVANIVNGMIRIGYSRISSTHPVTSLTQNVSRILIFGIAVLIILNAMGISIAPILATLGVGGLAVALALQDTLANLFSGIYISLARQIKVGDFVKLESGEEGYVEDITWRTTKIRMLPNNVVLIPNAKLAQAIIVNYHLPAKEMAVVVQVGVHYDSDLEKVERVTKEVASRVMKDVKGGVPAFEPAVRYHTLADSSINFSVSMQAQEFSDQFLIKHEFIKRLVERYRQEGIIIPYPIRAINLTQEKAGSDVRVG